jgi:Fic family protein
MDGARYATTPWGEVRRTLGRFGYEAYYPAKLPRRLALDDETVALLSRADLALGRLSGAGRLLPESDILIAPYVRIEALSSSRIEGTQATLSEIFDATATGTIRNVNIREVTNYIAALDHGLQRLTDGLPLSLRLLREMHSKLLVGVRGAERTPGQFRGSQNWIGAGDGTIKNAIFVPPPVDAMHDALRDWEAFQHEELLVPLLVQCALLHYQFETIHPFLDGNGRLGRLFIVLSLVERRALPAPLLYLSSYFEDHKTEYYEQLQAVREKGEIHAWLCFFLRAVAVQATDAILKAEKLVDLRERYRRELVGSRSRAPEVVDLLLKNPILTAKYVARELRVSNQSGLNLLRQLEGRGIVQPVHAGPGLALRWTAAEVLTTIFPEPAASIGAG